MAAEAVVDEEDRVAVGKVAREVKTEGMVADKAEVRAAGKAEARAVEDEVAREVAEATRARVLIQVRDLARFPIQKIKTMYSWNQFLTSPHSIRCKHYPARAFYSSSKFNSRPI